MVFRERVLLKPPIQGGATGDIALLTIDSTNLAANAVTTAKINDDAVTSAKIDPTAAWGTSSVKLLNFVPYYNAAEAWRVLSSSDTRFTGTINGAPTSTSVVYSVVTGNEDSIVPQNFSGAELFKIRLYNSTRGTYRNITAVNTGTNTITTASSSDSWANGDSIQVNSPTNTQTLGSGTTYFFELDCSGVIPSTAQAMLLYLQIRDSAAAEKIFYMHPYESYVNGKVNSWSTQVANVLLRGHIILPVVSQKAMFAVYASGAGTFTHLARLNGWWEEAST